MRPLFHPNLVNGRYGDPTVYVETLFEKSSLLFDLGEIASLSPRKIRRVDQIFVSHAHIDHFIGFDHLLRLLVGQEKTVHLYGPAGFAERVYHKLQAYRWNLVESYGSDLVFVVSELETPNSISTRQFRCRCPPEGPVGRSGPHSSPSPPRSARRRMSARSHRSRRPVAGCARGRARHRSSRGRIVRGYRHASWISRGTADADFGFNRSRLSDWRQISRLFFIDEAIQEFRHCHTLH